VVRKNRLKALKRKYSNLPTYFFANLLGVFWERCCIFFMLNTRLYVDLSKDAITQQFSTYILSYFKLRIHTAEIGSYGQIKISQIPEILGVSNSTAQRHIKYLSKNGYILEKGLSIEVKSAKNLSNKKSLKYIVISSETINGFSWKNIAEFRALLSEIVKENYEAMKNSIIKGFKVRDKHGYKTKVQDLKLLEFKELASLSLSAKLSNISIRTEQRYRSLQKVSVYKSEKIFINANGSNEKKLDFMKYLSKRKKGKFIEHNDKLFFSCVSERKSSICVNTYRF
jgi:DNA-binding Lrp family transcriptional regulator